MKKEINITRQILWNRNSDLSLKSEIVLREDEIGILLNCKHVTKSLICKSHHYIWGIWKRKHHRFRTQVDERYLISKSQIQHPQQLWLDKKFRGVSWSPFYIKNKLTQDWDEKQIFFFVCDVRRWCLLLIKKFKRSLTLQSEISVLWLVILILFLTWNVKFQNEYMKISVFHLYFVALLISNIIIFMSDWIPVVISISCVFARVLKNGKVIMCDRTTL
jgi:hypothetical protein